MNDRQVIRNGFDKVEIEHNVCYVPFNYRNLTFIASGVYGKVYQASNIIDPSEKLVIKQLCSPFSHPILAKRAYREIYLLRHLNHENIIELKDLFTPNISAMDFQQLYIVTGYAGRNLRGIDLKPDNMAVSENNLQLKILDFGLARHVSDEMTGYVATRYYRSPEIMFNWRHYTQKETSIDFLSSALNMDADIRPTAAQALEHIYFSPYRKQLHVLEDESRIQVDEDIEEDLSIEEWQQIIWHEINVYHNESMDNLQNNLSF
uniref:Protein kinase domain-containing protein n=1 Tax=Acrobeloides nanus TaxID=290746 RepID=A0A914DF33_9BILA